MSLFEKLEIFLLILLGIIFYEPKLSLSFNPREVKLRKLLLLLIDASANLRTVLEGLTDEWFNDSGASPTREYEPRSFKSPLQRGAQDDIGVEVL